MPLVSVVSARELLDARVSVGRYAANRGWEVVVAPDPSRTGLDASRAAFEGQGPLLLAGEFQPLWPVAFSFAIDHPAVPVLLATTTASLVNTLLAPDVALDAVQAALTGIVPLHPADGGILDRVQEARALSPLLRSPYEGVIYYLLEARRETRGVFVPNQRVAKPSGSGSWEVDLISHDHRFVIEIDGDQHASMDQRSRDDKKEEDLRQLGYEVLRFRTDTVAEKPVDVWQRILRGLQTRPQKELS